MIIYIIGLPLFISAAALLSSCVTHLGTFAGVTPPGGMGLFAGLSVGIFVVMLGSFLALASANPKAIKEKPEKDKTEENGEEFFAEAPDRVVALHGILFIYAIAMLLFHSLISFDSLSS
jgi:hypothetical protein